MTIEAPNKHAHRSAQTRRRFIEAAQRMFADRSIDAVSLNEITVAAGQKNRNALQYHFGNREGLLQAIIDTHATRVSTLRRTTLQEMYRAQDSSAHCAARALVKPLTDYIEENPTAIYYVKILSQMAGVNSAILNPTTRSGLIFHNDEAFSALVKKAVGHLQPTEAQRRLFLVLSITFHSIADVCRAGEGADTSPTLKHRDALFAQVTLAVETLLAAPALESNQLEA